MPGTLIRHGTEAGYKTEISEGKSACTRCMNAHRVYGRQWRASGKRKGLKYSIHEQIDHLYAGSGQGGVKARAGVPALDSFEYPVETPDSHADGSSEVGSGRSLRDKMSDLLGSAVNAQPYVPDYSESGLREIDPDPDPAGENWSQIGPADDDFVVTEQMFKQIQDNMGTYLSVVGMTAQMIDPYCGAVLAQNFDNMIKTWAKVVVHYPKAANLFLDGKGGVIFAWIGALQATWPLIMAIYDHHLAKNVATDREGNIFRRRKVEGETNFDPMQPPMPDNFDYSVR